MDLNLETKIKDQVELIKDWDCMNVRALKSRFDDLKSLLGISETTPGSSIITKLSEEIDLSSLPKILVKPLDLSMGI